MASVTLLGIGTVGAGIIELLPAFLPQCETLHVVDCVPDLAARIAKVVSNALPQHCARLQAIRIVPHVICLSADNLRSSLLPLFGESNVVMDLTTVVESEVVARLADECDCVYVNACIEVFAEDDNLSEAQRHRRFRNIKHQFKNTMVIEIGMNPGLISWLLMRGMRDAGFADDEIDTVHVTEYDTHVLRADRNDGPDTFYNTWSPFGLHEEARKKAEMAWAGPVPEGWRADAHLIAHGERAGFEVCLRSATPRWTGADTWQWAPYYGFVVTHGECETISHRLGRNVKCAFVYHTCPDATASLQRWKYDHATKYVMMQGCDVVNTERHVSADNIGALALTRDGRGWWCGSLCRATDAQRMAGVLNNGANVTVSAACLATVVWALAHPKRGCLFPDDLAPDDAEDILRRCEPYLGTVVSCAVPKHVLPPLDQPFVLVATATFPPIVDPYAHQ